MENEINPARLVKVMRQLPEQKFRIMDLAPQLLDDKGHVDVIKAIDRQPEINTAIMEVQSYIKEVKDLYRVVLFLSIGEKKNWATDVDDLDLFGQEDEDAVDLNGEYDE